MNVGPLPIAPSAEYFRALARSSPWRFTTLHFTHRRQRAGGSAPDGKPMEAATSSLSGIALCVRLRKEMTAPRSQWRRSEAPRPAVSITDVFKTLGITNSCVVELRCLDAVVKYAHTLRTRS